MNRYSSNLAIGVFTFVFAASMFHPAVATAQKLVLKKGDHVSYIGNTLADRMQHHSWLETYIHALHPDLDLTIRNLGFSADEIKTRPRSQSFGSPDQWLTKAQADVVLCFFGYNEALRGEEKLEGFQKDLANMIDDMRAQKYNGKSAPKLVVFSPIAHENLRTHNLPDGTANNVNLKLYTDAMKAVCQSKNVTFVDLFAPTYELYQSAKKPLTMNGIHLLDHGNKALARVIIKELFGKDEITGASESQVDRLRQAVLDKNYYWFSRYRVVDGYNVFGGRSKLAWDNMSNADVMKREMEIFDIMTANRDKRVWAVAKGGDFKVVDDKLPPLLKVEANKQSKFQRGLGPYLDPEEAIEKMTIAKGMQVNVFASEKMFPDLINPVQMAVDTDGQLFVSVWPSYPHWNPTKPRTDRIVCLPDEDNDGVADKMVVFADKLNSITGFEFWGGGMLVAAPPEIWFLKDTDGDDKADVKIRMLQGVSSADSHHTANAMLIGPDGWLYWSRGIFNTASMETPTKTYRSGASGVHRFNPRTFEMEFHFPIGPNPHGDVIDQWGYQFANDGTSGTGSYVNIGKGIGNKKWFKKRVRPVPATGILSSSHFPVANQGNFLICNAIGFLGVLQHEVKYNGADITAEEIEPIVVSSDPNFRPSDVEIGGDGALYISDWHNALIGHMQHNMRDPNRDDTHGRIYRVTYKGRPLLKPVKLKGKPVREVCSAFFAKENGVRYRARLELSGRETKDTLAKVAEWASEQHVSFLNDAQALLECLWVFEEHRVPNLDLLKTVFKADEPRVRAAAIRTLGHWAGRVKDWEPTLISAAQDQSALVRAEAVKAAVEFEGLTATEVIFEVATRPTDPELDFVLKYAKGKINVDKVVQDAIKTKAKLSTAAERYVLLKANIGDLLNMERTTAVYEAILDRNSVPTNHLRESFDGLAKIRKTDKLDLLMSMIERHASEGKGDIDGFAQLLSEQSSSDLQKQSDRIEKLALKSKNDGVRRAAFAGWIATDGAGDDAFLAATKNKERLRDFLEAVPMIGNTQVRASLYEKVQPLISDLPTNLKAEKGGSSLQQRGIKVDYFQPSASNVAIETLAKMKPKASGVVPEIVMNVPQLKQRDKFALRFTGVINVPRSGKYTFYANSDDGSRIYVADKLVVNNDGLHGMKEKGGSIDLPAGSHPLIVTYFDNGGGDGLAITWAGPGFKKQKIAPERLALSGGETLHDVAIRSLASIPGREALKFTDLAALVKAGKHRPAAIKALRGIKKQDWQKAEVGALVDNLIGFLSELPAAFRTGTPAMDAIALAKSLSTTLPVDQSKAILERLENLDVRVIAIGTVPHRMIFDKERIAVQAGKPVEFRFSNTDRMPHNFAIIQPGYLEEVGELAEATGREPDAQARHYIPKTDKVMLASRLLQAGERQALAFTAPQSSGIYPYVCTYPGHWRRMYGALYVVDNLEEYQSNPDKYLADHELPLKDELLKYNTRGHEWKFDELADAVKPLPDGRAFDVGKQLFKVANCVACHKLNNEGRVFGPNLAKLDPKKKNTEHILRSMVEPSKDIDKKFQSYSFIMESGKIVKGMIVEENDDVVKVVIDPLAKGKPTVLNKDEIDERVVSKVSIMPLGLLNKLSREEILDLIAYVYSGGDKKNKLFMQHKH